MTENFAPTKGTIINGVTVRFRPTQVYSAYKLLNCRKLLRILMMICLLHLAYSAILDVVKDSLSIISRIKTSFAGESPGAILPEPITVSREPWCRKLQLITKERGRRGYRPSSEPDSERPHESGSS
jgi:hypothetical protein